METAIVQQLKPEATHVPKAVDLAPSQEAVDPFWAGLTPVDLHVQRARRQRIVTVARSDPAHASFDILRTRVLRSLRQNNWTTLAITSPTSGCGKSVIALNLAFSLARLSDCRTVCLDLDFRHPRIAAILGRQFSRPTARFLLGQRCLQDSLVRYGDNLAISADSTAVSLAAELLQSPSARLAMAELKRRLRPDVILIDMPPVLGCDDVLSFLPNLDCALVVAGAGTTTIADVERCERELANETNILGIVLNKCRFVQRNEYY